MFGFLEEYVVRPVVTFFGLYTESSLPKSSIDEYINKYQNSIASGLSVDEACLDNPICAGFDESSGEYDYGTIALLGLGIGLFAVGSAAVYWYLKDDEYCPLTGKGADKSKVKECFLKTFNEILDEYKEVKGALPTEEQAHLEETLKSLFKYYFWKNATVPTDDKMRTGLYREQSKIYHTDKQSEDKAVVEFYRLIGKANDGTLFKIMGGVKDRNPNKSDNPETYQADKDFLKAIPNLSTALKTHKARSSNARLGKKM